MDLEETEARNDCAGEASSNLTDQPNLDKWLCRMRTSKILNIDIVYCWLWSRQMTDPSSRQRGRPTSTKPQLSNNNKNLFLGPRWGLKPGLTGQLTIGRIVALTLTLTLKELVVSCEMVASRRLCKHESRRISIAGNRNRATTSEDYNRLRERVL
jgi:hypothetical protein